MTLYPQDGQHWPFYPHEILSRWMGHTALGESLTGEQKGRGRVLLVRQLSTLIQNLAGVGGEQDRERDRRGRKMERGQRERDRKRGKKHTIKKKMQEAEQKTSLGPSMPLFPLFGDCKSLMSCSLVIFQKPPS